MTYELLKLVHLIGAGVLFGTGMGIAFFLFAGVKIFGDGQAQIVAGVCRLVVIGDYLFTLTAALLQPVTGLLLIWTVGYSLTDCWIVSSLGLYFLIACLWIPVVFMQIEMRDLAYAATEKSQNLPDRFFKLFNRWFLFGWPAFIMLLGIYLLMLFKPSGAYCMG